MVEAVEGEARRQGSKIEVSLKQPTEKKVSSTAACFSRASTCRRSSTRRSPTERFSPPTSTKGAGTGEASDAAAAAIGDAMPVGADSSAQERRSALAGVGRLLRADEDSVEDGLGEELPSYQMSFTLYENGVTNDLVMDYGDYALSGSLKNDRAAGEPRLRLTLSAFRRAASPRK